LSPTSRDVSGRCRLRSRSCRGTLAAGSVTAVLETGALCWRNSVEDESSDWSIRGTRPPACSDVTISQTKRILNRRWNRLRDTHEATAKKVVSIGSLENTDKRRTNGHEMCIKALVRNLLTDYNATQWAVSSAVRASGLHSYHSIMTVSGEWWRSRVVST